MMSKQLSIIIVTYNSKSIIADCLLSISKFNDIGDKLEVIIVDNNSNDQKEVYEIIQHYKDLPIVWITNPDNNGYGAGNNLGVQKATAPYILIMNPDVKLVMPVFKKLLALFNVQTDLAMVGVSFADKSSSLYLKPEYFTVCKILFIRFLQKIRLLPFNQMYMSGSFLIFDKADFLLAGGFDEKIFLYFEEADITNRLLKNSGKIHWANDLMVYHLTHQRKFNQKLLTFELDSLEYYMKKYNLNSNKIFFKYLIANYIKYYVALISRNQLKVEMFGGWIDLLKQKLL